MSISAGQKTAISDAMADVQAAIETMGTAWLAVLSAHAAAQGAAPDSARDTALNNAAGLDKLRALIHRCMIQNRLSYLLEESGGVRADGLTPTGVVPSAGLADIEAATTAILGGV